MAEDEIEQRLKDTTKACIEAYEEWGADKYDATKREALQDAVHELRKVASRLEIEMAAAERDEMNKKPIPMPSHRAARGKGAEDIEPQGGNGGGNGNNAQQAKSGQGKSSGNRSTSGQRRQRRSSSTSPRRQSGSDSSSTEEGNS